MSPVYTSANPHDRQCMDQLMEILQYGSENVRQYAEDVLKEISLKKTPEKEPKPVAKRGPTLKQRTKQEAEQVTFFLNTIERNRIAEKSKLERLKQTAEKEGPTGPGKKGFTPDTLGNAPNLPVSGSTSITITITEHHRPTLLFHMLGFGLVLQNLN